MNSINKNGCSVCEQKINIVCHKFVTPRFDGHRYWSAVILNENVEYCARITEYISVNGRKYYIGELYNDHIAKKYSNTYLVFGFSNYYGTYRYILEAMLRVIKGDYREIEGVGFCTATPNDKHKLH